MAYTGYVLDPNTEAEILGYSPYTGESLKYQEREFLTDIPTQALAAAPTAYESYYGVQATQAGNGAQDQPVVLQAGGGAILPSALALLARYFPSIAAALGGLSGAAKVAAGVGGAIALGTAAYQGLGFGQKGLIPGTMIPLVGPFAPEPPASMIAKEWSTGTARFYMLIDGSIVTRRKTGVWKRWRPAKHIVVSRNPRMGTLVRAHKRTSALMKHFERRVSVRMRK